MPLGDLQSAFPGGDRGLRHAPLRGHAGEEDPLTVQAVEDELQRRVVERGVSRLDHESFSRPRRYIAHQIPRAPLDGVSNEVIDVAIPHTFVVVCEDDGDFGVPRPLQEAHERGVSLSKRVQEIRAVLVREVVQHVDDEKDVTHR